jgi:CheY-like chemotaxis protein
MNRLDQFCFPPAEILIVDDAPGNLHLLSAVLKREKYKVRCAISGEIALRSIQDSKPDLILLDITMPAMDGYEVCRRLKADPSTAEIPVIFVSALDASSERDRVLAAGGVDYIAKPYRIQELLSSVHQALTKFSVKSVGMRQFLCVA